MLESFAPASAGVAVAAGMLTSLSPCVLPLLPIVVAGAMQRHRAAPLLMGLGMITAFGMGGWFIGALGPSLGLDQIWLSQAAAISLIIFGLVLWYEPLTRWVFGFVQPLADRADRLAGKIAGHHSYIAAFFFGGLLGLAWTPCAGPMLASVIALIANDSNPLFGAVLLGLYGLGAATPLVLAAYASRAGFSRLKGWALGHSNFLRHSFGSLAVLSGIFILTGYDKLLAAEILMRLPDAWLEMITSL